MKEYPKQPRRVTSMQELSQFLIDFLEAELPDCATNRWFVGSVNFANMTDKLAEEIAKEFVSADD